MDRQRKQELALCEAVAFVNDVKKKPLLLSSGDTADQLIDFALVLEREILRDPRRDADTWSPHDLVVWQDFRMWFKAQLPTRQAKVLSGLAVEHEYYLHLRCTHSAK